MENGIVDQDLIKQGDSVEEKISNGKYAISLARRLGEIIFTTPEDIKACNKKMIFAFACTLYNRKK